MKKLYTAIIMTAIGLFINMISAEAIQIIRETAITGLNYTAISMPTLQRFSKNAVRLRFRAKGDGWAEGDWNGDGEFDSGPVHFEQGFDILIMGGDGDDHVIKGITRGRLEYNAGDHSTGSDFRAKIRGSVIFTGNSLSFDMTLNGNLTNNAKIILNLLGSIDIPPTLESFVLTGDGSIKDGTSNTF